MRRSRFYLASALTNAEINHRVAAGIQSLGATCYVPQDDAVNKEPHNGGEVIAARNRAEIEACDCLVALFNRMGLDTSWEIGYATGLAKPCVLMCTSASLAAARASAMPFFSAARVVTVPDWGASSEVFAQAIGEALVDL